MGRARRPAEDLRAWKPATPNEGGRGGPLGFAGMEARHPE